MYELIHAVGGTYYVQCPAKIGIVLTDTINTSTAFGSDIYANGDIHFYYDSKQF